ncbi:MAG: DUF4296 domain-containing protein [Bacteroidetes bacterium]|jgi:hypothetical protein|nr:DUF4296 domain-containing protein [Bacteroidota bacterium]
MKLRVINWRLLHLVFGLTLLISCGHENPPRDVIPEEQYLEIYINLTLVNQLSDEQANDTTKDSLRQVVYGRYDTTEEQFKRSHQFYQQQAERQMQRIEEMNQRLTQTRDTLKARFDEQLDSLMQAQSVLDTTGR